MLVDLKSLKVYKLEVGGVFKRKIDSIFERGGSQFEIKSEYFQEWRDFLQRLPSFLELRLLKERFKERKKLSQDDLLRLYHIEKGNTFMCSYRYRNDSNFSAKILRSKDEIRDVLNHIKTCYPKDKLEDILDTFEVDMDLGGSVIFSLNKEGKPVSYNKLFLVEGVDGRNYLFYDAIENGNVQAGSIADWDKVGKIESLFYSLSFSLYLAQHTSCEGVALADKELDEFGSMMGLEGKILLKNFYDERKIGICASSSKGDGIYYNRLIGKKNKLRVMEPSINKSPEELLEDFRSTMKVLKSTKRRASYFNTGIEYLSVLLSLIESYDSLSSDIRKDVHGQLKKLRRKYYS